MQDYYWFIIFIAANSTMLLLFSINVSRLRLKQKVAWGDSGDSGDKALMKAIRVHANGTEQVPIYALIMLSLVFTGASNNILSALVIIFTLSRIIHAYGMLGKKPILRQAGAAVTYASQCAAVIALLLSLNT